MSDHFPSILVLVSLMLVGVACSEANQQRAKDDYLDSLVQAASEDTLYSPVLDFQAEVPPKDAAKLTWFHLQDVKFEAKFYEEVNDYMLFPTFGDSIKSMEGQKVYIAGYIFPMDEGKFILSANPWASCFFCGGSGPESVMQLELVDSDQEYYTDDWRAFSGVLKLNDTDIDKLNYILEGAKQL
ncbi:MAG: DUF3299 domain-containing protein [Bacteroidota bacterium]